MEGDYMENIRTVIEFLDSKISRLDEDGIQVAWKKIQGHLKHMNQLLVTERMDRQKEREQVERIRKLERRQWAAREACLVLHMEKLSADMTIKDWQLDQARKMEKASRETAERLKDRENSEEVRMMEEGAQKNTKKEWIEKMRKAAQALNKEHLEAQMKKRIQKLLVANEQLQDELLMKDEEIEEMRKKWKAEKKKVDKIREMSNELRSQNLEANIKYKAMMKQKTDELEREREMIRDPVAAIKENEDRILSAVPLVVIQKHRVMQELQKRVSRIPSENMSKEERREWKKIQKKKAKELKMQKKAEEKRRKEASKDTSVKSKEKMSFWKTLWCCKRRE